jgi:ribonuclease BN (tRNA processing enzyme)
MLSMDYYNFWEKEHDIDGNYKLRGFSRGSLRTGFILYPHKIFLDAGVPSQIKPNMILITHSHQDHIDSLYTHLIDNKKIDVIANINLIPFLQMYLDASKSLNCMEKKKFTNWNPKPIIKQLKVIVNSTKINIEAISLDHEVECYGYGISEIRTKLKEEYIGKKQEELNILAKTNELSNEYLYPILFFCGDMGYTSLNDLPYNKYSLFVIECSFLNDEHIKEAEEKQHLHIKHLLPIVEKYININFIFIHFSCRYNKSEIKEYSKKYSHLKNVIFWI